MIDEVKQLCFNLNMPAYIDSHHYLIYELRELFRRNGYNVERESPAPAHQYIANRRGAIKQKAGQIDLLAWKHDQKITIEYDSGCRLKYNSIGKLLSIDSDISIGIIKADSKPTGYFEDSIKRILLEAEYCKVCCKCLWLISLSEKRAELII